MEVVGWLILGLIGGVAAMFVVWRHFPRSPAQWLGALVVGLIGGWLGGWIATLLGLEQANWIGALVVSFVGAWIILKMVSKSLVTKA